MTIICYIFIFVFEQFVSLMYFNNKFYLKKTNIHLFIALFISFIIQFLGNLIGNRVGFPELNLITFFICNVIVILLLYNTTIKQALFNIIILESLMITSELGVMHLTSLLLKIDLQEYLNDNTVVVLETIGTKTLYFTTTYFISKFSTKEKLDKKSVADISYFLFILPASSIGIIISFTYLSLKYNTDKMCKIVFTIISLVLLFANIMVFMVHETMIKTIYKNAELELEIQKSRINEEYYQGLQTQYEASNILIHDIKRCLMNIRTLANNSNSDDIIDYVDSIYKGYDIKKLKQYSNNKLVNVIISRYSDLCFSKQIEFTVDIRNVDFSFIMDSDLTALLDNLLENAYEAASNSSSKVINLLIDYKNESYIMLNVSNSCDSSPIKTLHMNRSSKVEKGVHGIGLKIIRKIVNRYSGYLDYSFNNENNLFTMVVLIKTKL